jgi:hypothetical protein
MVLLWCVAGASIVIVATQRAGRTWFAYTWVLACLVVAIGGTVAYQVSERRRRRWDAGQYKGD